MRPWQRGRREVRPEAEPLLLAAVRRNGVDERAELAVAMFKHGEHVAQGAPLLRGCLPRGHLHAAPGGRRAVCSREGLADGQDTTGDGAQV